MRLMVPVQKIFKNSILLFLVSSHSQLSMANDYLSELEAEAQSIQENKGNNQGSNMYASLKLDNNQQAQITEFESTLKEGLPSTYKLFTRLSPQKRMVVVESYFLNNKQLSAATKQLFNLYFENK